MCDILHLIPIAHLGTEFLGQEKSKRRVNGNWYYIRSTQSFYGIRTRQVEVGARWNFYFMGNMLAHQFTFWFYGDVLPLLDELTTIQGLVSWKGRDMHWWERGMNILGRKCEGTCNSVEVRFLLSPAPNSSGTPYERPTSRSVILVPVR